VGAGATRLGDNLVSHALASAKILLVVNAIPAALTISAAREMVGRPFLRDHLHVPSLVSAVGPVHLIGCNRGATESQALQLLGFPDATVVTAHLEFTWQTTSKRSNSFCCRIAATKPPPDMHSNDSRSGWTEQARPPISSNGHDPGSVSSRALQKKQSH